LDFKIQSNEKKKVRAKFVKKEKEKEEEDKTYLWLENEMDKNNS